MSSPGVEYVFPVSMSAPEAELRIDWVSMGVELTTREGAICGVIWEMAGACEGLNVGSGRVESLGSFYAELWRADMTRSKNWEPFIGKTVRGLDVRWHLSSGECPPTLWALDLQFDTQAVTVALGELGSDGPTYTPDELLVIFDAAIAAAYRIPAAIDPPRHRPSDGSR